MLDLTEVERIKSKLVCLHDQATVDAAIDKIAAEMNEKLAGKNPILLCTLNGGIAIMGQLLTRLTFDLQTDYVHTRRYHGGMSPRDLHWMAKPTIPLANRVVVIVEDILDSGLTLSAVVDYCKEQKASEIYTAALVDKNHPREPGGLAKADFTGLHVEDKFLVGYGLDFQGFLRNLSGIYAVEG